MATESGLRADRLGQVDANFGDLVEGPSQHGIRAARSSIAIGVAAGLLVSGGVAMVQPATALGATSTTAGPPAYQWPEFHNTPDLHGVSADPAISPAQRPAGVKWMTRWGPRVPGGGLGIGTGETLVYAGTSAGNFTP